MIPRWVNLKDSDRAIFQVTRAFPAGRLNERKTVDWALGLTMHDNVKRDALLDLIDSSEGDNVGGPWQSAWRLIEESWVHPVVEEQGSAVAHRVRQRLEAGDRSGALVAEITKLVSPKLKIQPLSDWQLLNRPPPKRPRSVEHLFSTRLTSSELVNPTVLGIHAIDDVAFLLQLANALDSAVVGGLDIARRIGGMETSVNGRSGNSIGPTTYQKTGALTRTGNLTNFIEG
jgi:hypothetical protein